MRTEEDFCAHKHLLWGEDEGRVVALSFQDPSTTLRWSSPSHLEIRYKIHIPAARKAIHAKHWHQLKDLATEKQRTRTRGSITFLALTHWHIPREFWGPGAVPVTVRAPISASAMQQRLRSLASKREPDGRSWKEVWCQDTKKPSPADG